MAPIQPSSRYPERTVQLNNLQAYMVHEYVADYNTGHLSRRDLVRRVLNITGGLGSTATLLLALGCSQAAAPPTSPPGGSGCAAQAPRRVGRITGGESGRLAICRCQTGGLARGISNCFAGRLPR